MAHKVLRLDTFRDDLESASNAGRLLNTPVLGEIIEYATSLEKRLNEKI